MLQIALAMGLGMPLPRHPVELWLAFTFVAFAFLGLGLVIAMLADNVPAVQALGQCLFLPMLIIGGIAVPLASLPDWAQHVSAFFPGRYAVDAIQARVTGNGLGAARLQPAGAAADRAAGCLAGAKLFRWDAQQRFASLPGKGWVGVALMAWVAVGLAAERRGNVVSRPSQESVEPRRRRRRRARRRRRSGNREAVARRAEPGPRRRRAHRTRTPRAVAEAAGRGATAWRHQPRAAAPAHRRPRLRRSSTPPPAPAAPPAAPPGSAPITVSEPKTWQSVGMVDIERDLIFSRLPPDDGVVTPIAPVDEVPAQEVIDELEGIRAALPTWKPGKVEDLGAARAQSPLRRRRARHLPDVRSSGTCRKLIFDQLLQAIPKDDLIKILYWIGMHPMDGTDTAVDQLRPLGLGNGPSDAEQLRERTAIYAVKLLGQLTGKRPAIVLDQELDTEEHGESRRTRGSQPGIGLIKGFDLRKKDRSSLSKTP